MVFLFQKKQKNKNKNQRKQKKRTHLVTEYCRLREARFLVARVWRWCWPEMSLYLAKLFLLLYSLFHLRVPGRHGKMGGSNQVRVRLIGLRVKRVILSGLKFGSIGTGWVRLTRIFHKIFFFFFKKTTCICHLESYATNYLM